MRHKARLQRSIMHFDQALAVEFKLDCADLVFLDWFVYFVQSGKMRRIDRPGPLGQVHEFYWLSYDYVLASLPILGPSSKRSLARRLARLCEDHEDHGRILICHEGKKAKGRGTQMFFGFGPAFQDLVYKAQGGLDHRTDLSTGQQDHRTDLSTDQQDHPTDLSTGRPDHRTDLSSPYVHPSDSTTDPFDSTNDLSDSERPLSPAGDGVRPAILADSRPLRESDGGREISSDEPKNPLSPGEEAGAGPPRRPRATEAGRESPSPLTTQTNLFDVAPEQQIARIESALGTDRWGTLRAVLEHALIEQALGPAVVGAFIKRFHLWSKDRWRKVGHLPTWAATTLRGLAGQVADEAQDVAVQKARQAQAVREGEAGRARRERDDARIIAERKALEAAFEALPAAERARIVQESLTSMPRVVRELADPDRPLHGWLGRTVLEHMRARLAPGDSPSARTG